MVACALVLGVAPARAQSADVALDARATMDAIARTNRRLIGVGWDGAPFAARMMAPLRPNLVRIDAGFEHCIAGGRGSNAPRSRRSATRFERFRRSEQPPS